MNWFNQTNSQEAGATLLSMLMQARNNPTQPIDVASRFAGLMPNVIAQAVNFAYPLALSNSGGVLNEAQTKVLSDARMLASTGVMEQPTNDQNFGNVPQEPSSMEVQEGVGSA